MSEVPTYVLDNSVAVKWVLQLDDEPHLDRALEAVGDFQQGRANVIAPSVLDYEMGPRLEVGDPSQTDRS